MTAKGKTMEEQAYAINRSNIFGYLLGLLIFVIGIPALMWLVSGRSWPYAPESTIQCIISLILAVCGLALSIYSIVYMRIVGKGNPFDAYGHEVAPRTKYLMTSGPYCLCRNPMLVGIYIYDVGVLAWLWSALPLLIVLAEVVLLTLQVRSEEKRLTQDFGQKYIDYKKRVGRYYPHRICITLPVDDTQIERIKQMEQRFNKTLIAIKEPIKTPEMLEAIKEDVTILDEYYGSELWKQDFAADEAGNLPPDLKRGVLSEDGIWNLLSDYREIQKIKH